MRGEVAWRGPELFDREDWRIDLAAGEVAVLQALAERTAGRDAQSISRTDARLGEIGATAARLARELEYGGGAVLVRRLPADVWGADAASRAFWTLSLQLGTPVSQSAEGRRLFPVRDAGYAPGDPRFRGPMSNKRLSFHTDRCDVIAFLCVQPAIEGGDTFVVSSAALYEELKHSDPDTLEILRRPYPYLRHTVDRGNALPYCELPVFSERDGRFAAHFLRVLIDRADRSEEAPSLSDEQRAALDRLEELAEDPRMHVRFRMEPGEMLFVNNWTTFHRRSEFVDAEEPERKRHLFRIWLSMDDSRPIDPRFEPHFGATQAGALRGGMRPLEQRERD